MYKGCAALCTWSNNISKTGKGEKMNKKDVIKKAGKTIIGLGGKSVEKSLAFGMYDPEIPEVLKQRRNTAVLCDREEKGNEE